MVNQWGPNLSFKEAWTNHFWYSTIKDHEPITLNNKGERIMNQSVLISKVKGSYNRSSILLLSWTFEVWYLHWLDHASLGSHIDFERLMNLSRVKPAILSSKWVLVVKPPTVESQSLALKKSLFKIVQNVCQSLHQNSKLFWSSTQKKSNHSSLLLQ